MTPERFCYWLQGFAELNAPIPPTIDQWQSIREHLATVFDKVTPVMPVIQRTPAQELTVQDIIKSMPNQTRVEPTRIIC